MLGLIGEALHHDQTLWWWPLPLDFLPAHTKDVKLRSPVRRETFNVFFLEISFLRVTEFFLGGEAERKITVNTECVLRRVVIIYVEDSHIGPA